jgi:hypothetical protein
MSSSQYPLLAARWRALFGVWISPLFFATAPAAVVGVNLREASAPSSPGDSDYLANRNVGYYQNGGNNPFSPPSNGSYVKFEFTNLFLYGAQMVNLTEFASIKGVVLGSANPLISIEIGVSLVQRDPSLDTWASDLTVIVAPSDSNLPSNPDVASINFQLSGLGSSGFGSNSTPRFFWDEILIGGNPDQSNISDTHYLSSPHQLVLNGLNPQNTDLMIWLGNGFEPNTGASWGEWSGFVQFNFGPATGSGVPDASRTALLLAPGTLLLLGLAGRSRRRG